MLNKKENKENSLIPFLFLFARKSIHWCMWCGNRPSIQIFYCQRDRFVDWCKFWNWFGLLWI